MDDSQSIIFTALAEAAKTGETLALVTIIRTQGSMPRHAGARMLVRPDRTILGTVGGGAMEAQVIDEALAALQDGASRTRSYTLNSLEAGDPGVCGGTAELFIEPIFSAPVLLVIGAGHVGQALADLGRWLGFRVILSDDRAELCNPSVVPGLADYVVCSPADLPDQMTITRQTCIAIVSRGVGLDLPLIPRLLDTPAAYIGVIGSQRRWAVTVSALIEQFGLTEQALSRIRAPIGLELQAETPKEIALSILSEIVMLRRGGTGLPMTAG
jgi:xanthine dehydrogenase accessory factor